MSIAAMQTKRRADWRHTSIQSVLFQSFAASSTSRFVFAGSMSAVLGEDSRNITVIIAPRPRISQKTLSGFEIPGSEATKLPQLLELASPFVLFPPGVAPSVGGTGHSLWTASLLVVVLGGDLSGGDQTAVVVFAGEVFVSLV